MTKYSSLIALLVVTTLSSPQNSNAGPGGGLYLRNSTGTGCHIIANPVGTATIVYDRPEENGIGIIAVEFRIANLPSSYSVVVTPNPGASSATGDPFGAGCRIVFSECQPQEEIDLYEVTFTDLTGTREEAVLLLLQTAIPGPPDCAGMLTCNVQDQCFYLGEIAVLNGSTEVRTPYNPIPPDGALDVNLDLRQLEYERPVQPPALGCYGWSLYQTYFGTTPDPPALDCGSYPLFWCEGLLLPNTTYYWRVDTIWARGEEVVAGALWRFTTGTYVALHRTAWGTIKTLYR